PLVWTMVAEALEELELDGRAAGVTGATCVRYIGMMLNQFGDPQTAIAAYNFGPGAVGRGETWPSETNVYVSRVMNSWNQYGGQYATPYPTIDPPPLLSDATWSVTGYGAADAGAGSGIGSSGTLLLILLAVAAVALTKY
ncbi:hypothetical protein LCGC14_1539620, partial [marine sediment metagenome]